MRQTQLEKCWIFDTKKQFPCWLFATRNYDFSGLDIMKPLDNIGGEIGRLWRVNSVSNSDITSQNISLTRIQSNLCCRSTSSTRHSACASRNEPASNSQKLDDLTKFRQRISMKPPVVLGATEVQLQMHLADELCRNYPNLFTILLQVLLSCWTLSLLRSSNRWFNGQ